MRDLLEKFGVFARMGLALAGVATFLILALGSGPPARADNVLNKLSSTLSDNVIYVNTYTCLLEYG